MSRANKQCQIKIFLLAFVNKYKNKRVLHLFVKLNLCYIRRKKTERERESLRSRLEVDVQINDTLSNCLKKFYKIRVEKSFLGKTGRAGETK